MYYTEERAAKAKERGAHIYVQLYRKQYREIYPTFIKARRTSFKECIVSPCAEKRM